MALGLALSARPAITYAQGTGSHHVYLVPGVHYGTPSRTSFSLATFIDGRSGTVGKGYLLVLQGGRDAMKGQIGIANVSRPTVGWSSQVGFLRTRSQPIDAVPNSSYAGAELHLFIGVVNFGSGWYAPVSKPTGRRGLMLLSAGIGF